MPNPMADAIVSMTVLPRRAAVNRTVRVSRMSRALGVRRCGLRYGCDRSYAPFELRQKLPRFGTFWNEIPCVPLGVICVR